MEEGGAHPSQSVPNGHKVAEILDSQRESQEPVQCVLRQEGYILGNGRSFRRVPLVPPRMAGKSLALLNTKGPRYFRCRGLPQTQGFNHLANPQPPNPHWKAVSSGWAPPLLPLSAWCQGRLKINERKDPNGMLVKLFALPFFVSRKVQHLGDVYTHTGTHAYVFTCLQWNQATWKIPFHWLNSSWRIPPGNAFVEYVSYIMCRGPCRPSDMIVVEQLMDETSSSWPHRLQGLSDICSEVNTHPILTSENLLILICCLQLGCNACLLFTSLQAVNDVLSWTKTLSPASCPEWGWPL